MADQQTVADGASAGPSHAAPAPFVYTLGQIEPRFPSMSVEKEFAQVTGRSETAGLTDREVLRGVLSERANRYLARELCWVFLVQGFETYLLTPRDPLDLDLLIDAVRPRPDPSDLDVVIGVRGPLAPPSVCNGLVLPQVTFDQVYSFDRDTLLNAIPAPADATEDDTERFRATSADLLTRILQLADNAGGTDEHRALNFLVVRYPAIYARTAAAYADDATLASVRTRPSGLGGGRTIFDVIFTYRDRKTDVTDKYMVRVDVTEEFPFLVTKLTGYYDR